MRPDAADTSGDPLEQDAPENRVDDPAIESWFLTQRQRANSASDLRTFTTGNLVLPLVDGRSYFARLCVELNATRAGDQVYFLDFRGDFHERLDGVGSEVGEVLSLAARRGVSVFGLLWRSHPKVNASAPTNAEFVRRIDEDGGQVLLDARTRRAGSHHQKLVVIRHPDSPDRDVAFVGGIDLGNSRNDDSQHHAGAGGYPGPRRKSRFMRP
jgi:phosphatidylserine/phosphatidylglycerophosphate/cardiolipin synthase-like enzyme